MSGGSSSGKKFSFGTGKGGRKESSIVWEGSLDPAEFGEPVEHFTDQSKSDFSRDKSLRHYDNRKEEWPKCMHGEDCVVQMMTEPYHERGGRRFFKCPYAWSSEVPDNCGFVRWVDPPPIGLHQDYINYLELRIQDLQSEIANSSNNGEEKNDDKNNEFSSQEPICTDPYCSCLCHGNRGSPPSPPPPPPPPPPTMGGYCGEGATQFAMWNHY